MSGDGKSGVSRREFVKVGSAAAVGAPAALGLAGKAFASNGTNEIRCAVVGTGGRGQGAHIKSILNVPGARVVAICDPLQKALDEALAMFPGEKPATYTHHRELLDRENLDAAFIASPPVPHREQIVETLQRNLHCYAEKPVVLTVSDVEEVEQEAKRSKGILQVGQQLRYSTASRKITRMVHEGEIGRIGFVRAQRMSSWYGPGTEEPAMRWLWSVEESGDQLVEQSKEDTTHCPPPPRWVSGAGDHSPATAPIRRPRTRGRGLDASAGAAPPSARASRFHAFTDAGIVD